MENQERRSGSTRRVPVETLVEICGLGGGDAPAFEAESINVSGRGMHVRTAYLPEVGTPLVCRFEDRGREIIVEGVVAWRRDEPRGGEFGLRFTALDSGSVEVLRELCELQIEAVEEPEPESEAAEADDPPQLNLPGARVRLHIDGLGSPMRARVREGGSRRVHAGSNLEFLMVGKHLELENLDQQMRRSARIDAVEVVIDPQTQIPQLVVSLHYDDVDDTPEPSVVDTEEHDTPCTPLQPFGIELGEQAPPTPPLAGVEASGEPDGSLDAAETPSPAAAEDEVIEQANALRARLDSAAAGAGTVAKSAGTALARLGSTTATGMRKMMQDAGSRMIELKQRRAIKKEKQPRRATAEHPDGPLSVEGGRLRPQGRPTAGPALRRQQGEQTQAAESRRSPRQARARKLAVAGAALAVVATAGAIAMRSPAPPPGAEQQAPPKAVSVAVADEVADDVKPGKMKKPKPTKVKRLQEPKASSTGITADVPLFGPTPMATMEPAPLGPAPEEASGDGAPAASKTKPVEDETFASAPDKPKVKPKDVKPWGRGRMHLPVIHRLRLDTPGTAIQGAIDPTGFAVVIPGRKVMENGRGISKRDKRIARVRAQNTVHGAQISFKFREGVPGYRVRLRKDFVEFLISSPKE